MPAPAHRRQATGPATGFRRRYDLVPGPEQPVHRREPRVTETAETTGGEFVRFDWRSSPGGIISEHVHPRQEERFTIISGVARFTVNGRQLVAEAGQTLLFPPACLTQNATPGLST